MNQIRELTRMTGPKAAPVAALAKAGRLVEARLDSALAPLGLSSARVWVLLHLADAGGAVPLTELAERTGFVKSNATQMADRLQAEGLARRAYDPDDRRRVLAEVTEEGRGHLAEGLRVAEEVQHGLLKSFGPAERDELVRMLERLFDDQGGDAP